MAKTKCTAEELPGVINNIFKEYLDNIAASVADDVEETGKACKKLLRAYASAAGIGGSRYLNSFRVNTEQNSFYVHKVTLNSSLYQLTHLLEDGHYIYSQRRKRMTSKRTRAFPHWEPAEKEANKMLEEKITATIERQS